MRCQVKSMKITQYGKSEEKTSKGRGFGLKSDVGSQHFELFRTNAAYGVEIIKRF
jgi:hypothetical protein